jgi:diacylglycerol kinase (ATP)
MESKSRFKSVSGAKRLKNAFGYSLEGLLFAWRSEAAFRQELQLFLLMFLLSWGVALEAYQYLTLLSSMMLVLILELVNSAIEALADRITSEFDSHVKAAKDLGSAAVLLGLLWVIAVWCAWVLYPLCLKLVLYFSLIK